MTCEYKEYADLKTVEIMMDGKLTEEDFDRVAEQIEAFIKTHGKIKIIEIIRNFGGFEWAAFTKGFKFDMEHMKDFSHCAVVTDEGWIGPFSRMLAPFFSIGIKTFKLEEEQQARDWLKSA